jgi:histone arginine demethylase JMJD6
MFETPPPSDSIERISGLSHQDIVRRYVLPMRPVILTDAITRWPALRRWTPEFFRERYGSVPVDIDGKTWKLGEYIDALLISSPEQIAPYLRNQLIEPWIPELMADITPLPRCVDPNWLDSRLLPTRERLRYLEIFIGGAGARFPILHYDGLHTHAWLMQVYGTKRYVVYSPDQTEFVYPFTGNESNRSSIRDIEHPNLKRFPLFAKATPTVFDLHPGETLFVPSGWWHTVKLLSPSITISVNAANRPNWGMFVHDFVESKRAHRSAVLCAALHAYLILLGWGETILGTLTGWTEFL